MTRLGRYELLEKLGEGGMGAVWLGRLTGEGGFEKLCILKTVLPAIAKDTQFVSRFLHEGRVLTQLQHSNIAQVFDMGREGDTVYLALEYVPGVDLAKLHQHLRDSGQLFPVPAAIYIVQQMAEGLGFAHRKRAPDGTELHIVHRDVSPQNVMVSYDGEVKVIDFGIAKSQARSHATASATVLGKLGYMAPEQARGEIVDARADQYAAAVLLWELLTNDDYVPRGTMTEMVVAMANPPLRPLAKVRPDLPPTLEAVVLKALASNRDHRYPTTDDFASALMNELLQSSGLPTKLQVGEWVRATCPTEFDANKALITRVSTVRPAAAETPVDRTFVRPAMTVAPPPQTTGDVAALALRRSRTPMVAGVVALVLAAAALVWFGTRDEGTKAAPLPPVAMAAPTKAPEVVTPPPVAPPLPGAPPPVAIAAPVPPPPAPPSPGAEVDAGAATPTATPPAPVASIALSARRTPGPPWSLILSSKQDAPLTDCAVHLAAPALSASVRRLPSRSSVELPSAAFVTRAQRPNDVPDRGALVVCAQGRTTVRW